MESPLATVIIPNYKGADHLPALRDSLRAQSEGRFRVIVVDDSPDADDASFIARDWTEALLIRNEKNLGFAASCNRGLESATGEFVVLLNNDTFVDQHWMREGLAAFASDRVAGVASLILLADPPHLVDSAGDAYSIAGGAQKRCHGMPRETVAMLPGRVFSCCGASAFYRREALASVGNLDPIMGSYYDDVDIGFRLLWAGYECVFAPASICYHRLSASYNPRGWQYHFNSARNAELIWQSYVPADLRRKYRGARRWFLAAQALYKLRLGCLRAHLAGRRAARDMQDHIAAKRAALARFAAVSPAEIERRLHQDWRGLHIRRGRIPA